MALAFLLKLSRACIRLWISKIIVTTTGTTIWPLLSVPRPKKKGNISIFNTFGNIWRKIIGIGSNL